MLKMLNCHDATRLISSAMDQSVENPAPLSLKLHLMMCSGCRRYVRQTQLLRQVSRQFVSHPTAPPSPVGSDADESASE